MYSPNVKPERKMKLEDFVKNLRGKQTLATVIIKVSSCNFHWKNNIFLWEEKKKKGKMQETWFWFHLAFKTTITFTVFLEYWKQN